MNFLAKLFRRGTALSRNRSIATSIAAFALAITALATMFTYATYEGVEDVTSARAPRFVEVYGDESPAILWAPVADAIGLKYTDIVSITPLIDSAPRPPGVTKWPQPGEAIVSPELYDELLATRALDRYGEVVGIIGNSGLAHPTERLAYVRPATPVVENGHVVSGYGIDGPAIPIGDPLRAAPFSAFVILLLIVCAVPVVVLLIVSARIDSKERALRIARLRVLGMTRGQEWQLVTAETARPFLIGSLAAFLCAAPFFVWNISLPGVRFTLQAAYLRDHVGVSALVAVSSICIGFTLTVAATWLFSRELGGGKPRVAEPRHRASIAIICVSMLFATPWLYSFIAPGRTGNENLAVLTVTIGSIICLLSLPHAVQYIYTSMMGSVRRLPSLLRAPSLLVGSANAVRWPGAPARLAATFAVMIGLVGLAHIWDSALTKDEMASRQLYDEVGDSLVTVTTYGADRHDELEVFHEALAPGVHPYQVASAGSGELTIYSTEDGLGILNLEPGSEISLSQLPSSWQRYLEFTEGWNDTVRAGTFDAGRQQDNRYVLFSSDPSGIPVDLIRADLNQYSAPVWPILSVGHSWRGGVWLQAEQSRWLSVFAGWGVIVASVAVWFGSVRYLHECGVVIARLTLVGGTRMLGLGVAFWLLFPAVGIGLLSGWTVSRVLGAPFLSPGLGGVFPVGPLAIYSAVLVIASGFVIVRLATHRDGYGSR